MKMTTYITKRISIVLFTAVLCGQLVYAHPHLWLYYLPLFTFSEGKLHQIEVDYCFVQYPPMTCSPVTVSEIEDCFSSDYPYVPHIMINGEKVNEIKILPHTNEVARANGTWRRIVYELPEITNNTAYEIRFSLQSGNKKDPGYCMTYATGTNVYFSGEDFTLAKSKVSMFGISLTARKENGHSQPVPDVFVDHSPR
jgi:hypothetical protein